MEKKLEIIWILLSLFKGFLKRFRIPIRIFLILLIYYSFFYYKSSGYDFVITWNIFSGEMLHEKENGYHLFSPPWVLASKIDTRPHRVCIATAARNTNCRLVRFNPAKWEELIDREGFAYYWWYNRFSFSWSQETYRGVENLLLGHAYGSARCGCVEVMEEIGDENQ